jgi:hypothetical protein
MALEGTNPGSDMASPDARGDVMMRGMATPRYVQPVVHPDVLVGDTRRVRSPATTNRFGSGLYPAFQAAVIYLRQLTHFEDQAMTRWLTPLVARHSLTDLFAHVNVTPQRPTTLSRVAPRSD